MDSFPNCFNKDMDTDIIKQIEKLKVIRQNLFTHFVDNGTSLFFDISPYDMTDVEKKIIEEELTERGFKYKYLFYDTAILIYVSEDDPKIGVWLQNETL